MPSPAVNRAQETGTIGTSSPIKNLPQINQKQKSLETVWSGRDVRSMSPTRSKPQ